MTTPALQQYAQIRSSITDPNTILFFRMGDFYEMFFEDALLASRLLDITLTTRNKNDPAPVPLCGVPYHAAQGYIDKLLSQGKKVAICEQMEDPKFAKGVVKREITQIITPGVVLTGEAMGKSGRNIVALCECNGRWSLACADVSTGEFATTEAATFAELCQEIARKDPQEVVLDESLKGTHAVALEELGWLCTYYCAAEIPRPGIVTGPAAVGNPVSAMAATGAHPVASPVTMSVSSCAGAAHDEAEAARGGTEGLSPSRAPVPKPAVRYGDPCERGDHPSVTGPVAGISERASAATLLWSYLHYTNRSELAHFTKITPYIIDTHVRLDDSTIRHLELVRPREPGADHHTVFSCMDRTVTAMGARRLKHWLLHPLRDIPAIRVRQDMVAALVVETTVHLKLRELLESVADMERIIGRIATGFANARDVVALAQSLLRVPEVATLVATPPALSSVTPHLHHFPELARKISETIVDEPPVSLKEGGLIRSGVHPELDELRSIRSGGKQFIAQLETMERERTGINSLKVGFNRVFGYYLEITHSHRDKIPADYIRKQTLTNAERYITPELKQYEEKVLGAEERITALEYELFAQLRADILPHVAGLQETADVLGTLDVVQGLALLARDWNYCRPKMLAEPILDIRDGRHPVVEQANTQERFVPNDVALTPEKTIAIITGPNMAGKSTVMRQTALITLMAHMGSFVPAGSATIGVVDRIFTRVGASDNLARGQSTFMVEMTEAAAILSQATAASLIIIDEIGRGTSTFDGISIAWAVAEHLHDVTRARCLFATHYHELTDLPLTKAGMANFTMAIKEWNHEIIFLRKLIPGGASRSYGIQVAKLAGLPETVISRAKEVLATLEQGEMKRVGEAVPQMQLFTAAPEQNEVITLLQSISPDTLTPIEALNILRQVKLKIS